MVANVPFVNSEQWSKVCLLLDRPAWMLRSGYVHFAREMGKNNPKNFSKLQLIPLLTPKLLGLAASASDRKLVKEMSRQEGRGRLHRIFLNGDQGCKALNSGPGYA